jgi:hypothetical protein
MQTSIKDRTLGDLGKYIGSPVYPIRKDHLKRFRVSTDTIESFEIKLSWSNYTVCVKTKLGFRFSLLSIDAEYYLTEEKAMERCKLLNENKD